MNILFVCKSNIGRSQSAEFFFNNYSKIHTAISAGIKPVKDNEKIIKDVPGAQGAIDNLMKYGYDISNKERKQITEDLVNQVDKVYLLMEEYEENIPDYLKKNPKVIFHPFQNTKNIEGEEKDKITEEIKQFAEEIAKSLE